MDTLRTIKTSPSIMNCTCNPIIAAIHCREQPAGMTAGLPGPVAIHFDSGAWDAAYHWRLEDGYERFEWRVHPNDVAFRKALIEQEGSEEAADEIIARYESLIARTNNVIGHRHLPDEYSDSE